MARIMPLLAVLLVVALIGCVQPEAAPTATPMATIGPTPTPTPEPTATPAPTPTPTPEPTPTAVAAGKFLVYFPWPAGESWRPSTAPHDPELALDFHVEGYSAGPTETPKAVVAAAPGTVMYAIYSYDNEYYTDATGGIADYGNMVVLKHDGAYTMYTHLKHESPAPLKVGDAVASGQRIGWMGYSGWSRTAVVRGAHLHFAVVEGFDFMFNVIPKEDWGFRELNGSKDLVLERDYVSQNKAP